jgi:hypothetical protein
MTARLRGLGLALVALLVATSAHAQDKKALAAAQAQRDSERAALLHFCQQVDQTAPATVQGATDRTDCWKRMQLEGMGGREVDAGYQAAVADYRTAMAADSMRRSKDSSTAAMDARLQAVQRSIQTRNLDDAESSVDDILAIQPQNQRALAFKDRIVALKRARQLKMTLFAVGAAVLVLGAGLAVVAKKLGKRHGEKKEKRKEAAKTQGALLKIVDGVGRGKTYQIEGAHFRIGAAGSDKPEERNDLILSDSASAISRFHCSIVRKDGRFYLTDSSLNGTRLNDKPLGRGDRYLLRDGDEFTLADVSRLKFFRM